MLPWSDNSLAGLLQAALTASSLPQLAQQASALVVRSLGVQHSGFWELLPGNGSFVLRAGSGWPAEASTSAGSHDASFSSGVLDAGPYPGVDWRTQPGQPELLREHGVVSSLCVLVGDALNPAGMLSADSTEPRTFDEDEVRALCMVADVLALAAGRLSAAGAVEAQVRERTLITERRRQVAHSLYEILSILNRNHTLDGLLSYIIAQACRLLGAAAGMIYRLQSTGEQLTLQASWGVEAGAAAASIALDDNPLAEAVRTRMPVTLGATPRPDGVPVGGFGSLLAVPMLVKAEVYGVIALLDSEARRFSEEDAALATTLGDHAALAIENARLVAAAQNRAVLEERQRLARDLHDSVTQALYGVTLHAQAARRLLEAANVETASHSLRALQDTAQEALDEMRLLIFELRPPILDQAGLVAALQARLEAVEGRINLQTRLIVDQYSGLASPLEHALYRIAQEALNNALRYSHASRITVQLNQTAGHVLLRISDDGVGFDPAADTGGLGLRGIRERVAGFGGHVDVASAPGAGTQLSVEIAV